MSNLPVTLRVAHYEIRRLRDKLAQIEFDRDVALDACGALSVSLKAAEARADHLANLNRGLLDVLNGQQIVPEVEAFLAHPSQGGES